MSSPANSTGPLALSPPAGHPRFPLMDAERAIAALLIVAYHVAYVSGALYYGWASKFTQFLNVGVAVFFVISGFLLYRPFVAARFGAPARTVRSYSRNRVLRIIPGYWVALTLAAIYPGLTGVFTRDWAWYYGFGQIYSQQRQLLGMPVAWTLAVEVSFYLLLPLYALGMRRFVRDRPRWAEIELGGLLALCVLCAALQATAPLVHLSTITATFDWFAVGMAFAIVSVRGQTRVLRAIASHPGACWFLAIAIYLAMCEWMRTLLGTFGYAVWGVQEVISAAYAMVAGLIVLPAVFAPPGRHALPQRLLSVRTLGWLGLISYGLYLYHLPVLVGMRRLGLEDMIPGQKVLSYVIVALPVTIALAAASYYVIERPALRLKRRRPEKAPVAEVARKGVPS